MSGNIEKYFARRGSEVPAGAAALAAAVSPFTIEVRFMGGLTTAQKDAFKTAAKRWTSVIVGDLPAVNVDGETIDDLLILAQGSSIDGPGGILGQAGPTDLRPMSTMAHSLLPAKGVMSFDSSDLTDMEADGTLVDVITHEMGHVLGVGTIWEDKGLLQDTGTLNPVFIGSSASQEWTTLSSRQNEAVPVEATGGPGTRDSHWRDTVFVNELMTGFVNAGPNPLSRLTVASMQDLGYQVDMTKADNYALPNFLAFAIAGRFNMAPRGRMMRMIPRTLPEGSLV